EDGPPIRIFREWATLIICMLIVAGGVELLVLASINLGKILGTPSFLWGLTVIAAGTSLPDLFISVSAAKQGKSITSLSNVLGSNTFDLLIAVPIGVLLAGATAVNFARAVPMMASLTFATIVMFVFMRLDMDLNRREAILLLLIYALFVVWMALEAFGIMTLLGVTPPV
ncbi:MAG: sodium:calcium antiporter, partial [Planctomycetota bacterium]|nr:sodium:calcium antiporter [Planctomycetota bacterium]